MDNNVVVKFDSDEWYTIRWMLVDIFNTCADCDKADVLAVAKLFGLTEYELVEEINLTK